MPSIAETLEHIDNVRRFLNPIIQMLIERAEGHDLSKLLEPERSMFNKFTPINEQLKYGSDEYYQNLGKMLAEALSHHYDMNSHHPQFFDNGIDGMSLIDLMEMMVDWKASTMKHKDGDINNSLEINRERFNISDQLYSILKNTIKELGW